LSSTLAGGQNGTHWTTRRLAKGLGISHMLVARVVAQAFRELEPHHHFAQLCCTPSQRAVPGMKPLLQPLRVAVEKHAPPQV
jgi:hypothetical protein